METPGSKALYTRLMDQLRQQILDGTLPPGSKLPPEVEMARSLHLSRGTVRQALTALTNEGLLDRTQRRGTFVRDPVHTTPIAIGSRRIGLVLSLVGSELDLDILLGVENAAKSRGYQVSFAYAEENLEEQQRDIARLRGDYVAGMIIFPVSNISDDVVIRQLYEDGMPIVLVDRYLPELDTDWVTVDNTNGGYRATEHLIILGNTRIGFVYSTLSHTGTTSVRDRFLGYRQALESYGLPFDERLVVGVPQQQHRLTEAKSRYDALMTDPNRPEAFFAVHDGIALGLLQAAYRNNLRVPDDLAIVGFDNLSFVEHLTPPLTTVAQPRMDVGLRAGNLLINRIEGQQGPPRHIELPTSLIVRESCGARLRVGRRTDGTP